MMSYEINTIEEFYHRINAQGDQCNFKELMKSTSPSVFECKIHIRGDGYDSSFPLQLMQGIDDLQTAVFRSYAFAACNKLDLRGVHKDDLWMTVKVEKGSTVFTLTCAFLAISGLAAMFKDMTTNQRWATIILIAMAFAGYLGSDWHSSERSADVEEQRLLTQAQETAEKEQTERERIKANSAAVSEAIQSLTRIATENPRATSIVEATSKNLAYGTESVVRNAKGASFIEARGQTFSQTEIETIQKHPEAQPTVSHPLQGIFRIVQINSENHELWKIQLKNVKTNEKISATLHPNTLFFNIDQANELFEYQKLETSLSVKLHMTERASGNTYLVERIVLPSSEGSQP